MQKLEKTAEQLRKNNMTAYVVENRTQALELVKNLVPTGATVGAGGSHTLGECGVLDYLRRAEVTFYERKATLSAEETEKIFALEKTVDIFFSSSNAITEAGELYNVDGRANRIAAICHGAKNVIIVAGKNKIVNNIVGAVERVKTIAAPKNAQRLNCQTPCRKTGHCISIDENRPFATDGCSSPDRVCCQYLISGQQKQKGRITVILVNEDLGY